MNKTSDSGFLRRYRCTVADAVWEAEFDEGFLSLTRRVGNAHNHAGIELIANQSGVSAILMADRSYKLKESDLLLIPSGIYHANDMDTQTGDRFCLRIYPPDSRWDSSNPLAALLSNMTEPICFSLPELLPLLASIRREMCENLPASEDMIHLLLKQCFVHLFRWASRDILYKKDTRFYPRKSEPEKERLKKIDFFFSLRYMQPVTLRELAEYLRISPTHTNRVLRSYYGCSFLEKLRDTRLHQARILLEQSTMSVNRVANEVGYSSIAGFYSAFRKAFGLTPSEYRIKKQKEAYQNENEL